MKVFNCGCYAAEDIELTPDTVMISINEEYKPLCRLKSRDMEKVFTAAFTDITAPITQKGEVYHPISSDTARAMYQIIVRNKVKNYIVHCAAGISRSAAVALFIHNEYGHELKEYFWDVSSPNPFVLGSLLIAKHKEMKNANEDPKLT